MPGSAATQYGFRWGPLVVERIAHVEGRGYSLEVRTDKGKRLQVYVSEKGQALRAYPQPDYRFERDTDD